MYICPCIWSTCCRWYLPCEAMCIIEGYLFCQWFKIYCADWRISTNNWHPVSATFQTAMQGVPAELGSLALATRQLSQERKSMNAIFIVVATEWLQHPYVRARVRDTTVCWSNFDWNVDNCWWYFWGLTDMSWARFISDIYYSQMWWL